MDTDDKERLLSGLSVTPPDAPTPARLAALLGDDPAGRAGCDDRARDHADG